MLGLIIALRRNKFVGSNSFLTATSLSKLPKKFKVVDDTKYGWWYLQVSGVWYGIEQSDYGTPPFEY